MTTDETNNLLKEILKWQKLQGIKTLRELIPTLLDDDKKRLVYELTDGKHSQQVIAKEANVAGGTVSNWWNSWYAYGLLTKENNRYVRLVSLEEIGLCLKCA